MPLWVPFGAPVARFGRHKDVQIDRYEDGAFVPIFFCRSWASFFAFLSLFGPALGDLASLLVRIWGHGSGPAGRLGPSAGFSVHVNLCPQ